MYAYPGGEPTGDEDAFAIMCERYRSRLVAFCRRRLRTSHDAEDIAHETLLRAFHAMPGFDPATDAWPWLCTIAARVCTDVERRTARAPGPPSVDEQVDDVHDQVVARLRADILDDAIAQLPPRYRMPLLLREYGGWSYGDIARTQGKSLASVRSILTRSRRRLGTHVESVARARGQWPLPGVVPPMQRLRSQLRSWRATLDRSGHVVMGALDLSSVAARWMIGANATLASMLTFSTAAAVAVLPPTSSSPSLSHPTPAALTVELPRRESVVATSPVPVAATATTVGPAARETLTRVEASAPLPEAYRTGIGAVGGAGVDASDEMLFIGHRETITAPIVGEIPFYGRVSLSCEIAHIRETACATFGAVNDIAAET
jgi:RNA polymerase sigma factor (sigma-70 family)